MRSKTTENDTCQRTPNNEQLAKEIKAGNENLIPELWDATRLFIFHQLNHIVKRNQSNQDLMISAGITKEDLYQEAFFILLEAVNAFNPAGGYSFLSSLEFAAQNHFFALVGMRTAKGRNDPLNNSDRFERQLASEDEEICLGDTIPDPDAENALDAVIEREYQRQCRVDIDKALKYLTDTEKRIIIERYYKNKRLPALQKEYGIPTEKINQYHKSALRKLRSRYELRKWRDDIIDRSYALGGVGFFKETGHSSVEWAVSRLDHRPQFDVANY